MRFLALPIVALMLAGPVTVQAQQPLPIIDQLTSPFTDSELGGIGCLTATTATGGMLVYLLGGFGRIAASMQGPLPSTRVMEGTAAAAFIFSSACYVGAALAPVAMMAYTSITDNLPNDFLPSSSSQEKGTGDGASVAPGKSSLWDRIQFSWADLRKKEDLTTPAVSEETVTSETPPTVSEKPSLWERIQLSWSELVSK
ncbi:membrane hypothetical protein [Gammaproteobacteria bacterium]